MHHDHFIIKMYQAIDAKSSTGMCDYVTDDAVFRFANMPAVEGKSNIIAFLDGFFQSIKAIRHTDIEYWNSGNAWFVTGTVNYTRHNDTVLSVPFGVLLKMNGDLIKDYLIFVDASQLYAA
jgi:ketosteroid isomerase-like protein